MNPKMKMGLKESGNGIIQE
ncbi:uncharacterized protein G2W53_002619 [Senna tora]|uniref:Uncharacterized protein n=1 Tax=Senna tora TaxID=362788 RepID=A0A834X8F4_9FABA|nr:uncharacterized protein G2W53_002619 [Senna tora]